MLVGGAMDKIRNGKWNSWIVPLGVFLRLFCVITSQPGFLSISCGGKENYTAENNITWVTDAAYIDVGEAADIGDASALGSYLHSLRYFPKPLNRSCYQLPVAPNVPHLLRLWFVLGNFSRYQQDASFSLSMGTVDMMVTQSVEISTYTSQDQSYYEYIIVTSGRALYICLFRTQWIYDPFISAIELRRLQPGMYHGAKPGTPLFLYSRYDVGGNSVVRYPQDKFDRIWIPLESASTSRTVSVKEPISTANTKNLPPTDVMQTAWVTSPQSDPFTLTLSYPSRGTLLMLYFAETETMNMSESRSFNVRLDGKNDSETITLMHKYSALEVTIAIDAIYTEETFELVESSNSTLPPIINAYESYTPVVSDLPTYSQDVDALKAIKGRFHIKDWISDPCDITTWNGIGCDDNISPSRISEIDLSGRKLTGTVPNDIAQLTALVNVSLANNYLAGPLPNFTNLTQLERLYLQNNNLSGTLEWLSKLKNLKELNIKNNNFTGVIPAKLFRDCSLKLNYSGNPYLRMNKRQCAPHDSNKNKLKIVLGTTLTGIIMIPLIVAIVTKFRRVATERTRAKTDPTKISYEDTSVVIVPTPTKSRAFTLDEMIAATHSFSREIGRGGFGSVFLGELPQGQVVAVKVLSLFSRQGLKEFLNEVDLLSKINHRNLVSLLGYCNETKEVMLIYDYMSGGSLRDHLHGPTAENSELNWKRRLKIALDAAQGLEYLHVGCTPKIIHRDIKTANILLDSNSNGKLADFGLSRMAINGEATHITTVVKGTFGYLDPEYFNTQMLTEKSDVYSFGVVLLEIICGRIPIDIKLPEEKVNIIRWVTPYLAEMGENGDEIIEIIDKRLCGGYDIKSMTRVVKVAMRCVQAVPSCRPSMCEIVAELKEAIKDEDKDSIFIAEDIVIENGDLVGGRANSNKREGMEWGDNSSNLSNVGR